SNLKENKKGWKGFNWAFGYNRENSYKASTSYESVNAKNSLLDSYVEQTNGVPVSNLEDINYAFGPGMAYKLYLLNPSIGNDNTYTGAISHGGELQRERIKENGSTGNWFLGLATNYNNKLFIGGTFELKVMRYEYSSVY